MFTSCPRYLSSVCWLKAFLGVIFILTWRPRPAELPLSGGVPIGCGGAGRESGEALLSP